MAVCSDARAIVKQFRGEWRGKYGVVPGPGHSPRDRSLKVWDAADGSVRVHSFAGDDWRVCRQHLGLDEGDDWRRRPAAPRPQPAAPKPSGLPERVRQIARTACAVELVPDAVAYLGSRLLWPLPPGCGLKAHASAEYWHRDGGGRPRMIGRFPALVAEVRDGAGALVTVHVTYLHDGRKLASHEPRKILSGTSGHTGSACRLLPIGGPELGIAEGIETALAAQRLHGGPVWAALNAGLLAAFVPPQGVERLVIYADADAPGLKAAWALRDRLPGVPMELRAPPAGCKDWADALGARHG